MCLIERLHFCAKDRQFWRDDRDLADYPISQGNTYLILAL